MSDDTKSAVLDKPDVAEIPSIMTAIMEQSANPPQIGDLMEGKVINIDRSSVYIDLYPFGTGIIYGREFINARDIIRKVNVGDMVAAKVVDRENENGYIELSLKETRQALIWSESSM